MPQIPGREFWSKEKKLFWDEIASMLILLIHAGGESGFERLPAGVKLLMNWDVFNRDAVNFLREYRLTWVNDIADTTRDQAVDVIADWIENGEPKDILDKRLGNILGTTRAKNIATTEVTRVYAKGNQLAWKATRIVTAQKWQTAQDERVCPLCGPLHNQTVSIDSVFTQSASDIANSGQMRDLVGADAEARQKRASSLIRHSGAYIGNPPRHPGCRCWLLPVVSEEAVRGERRRRLGLSSEFNGIDIDAFIAGLKEDERVEVV